MLKTYTTPMRADLFIMKHVSFMSGRVKLASSTNKSNQEEKILNEPQCSACKNELKPSGAHSCFIFNKYVHAPEQCSKQGGCEGF